MIITLMISESFSSKMLYFNNIKDDFDFDMTNEKIVPI